MSVFCQLAFAIGVLAMMLTVRGGIILPTPTEESTRTQSQALQTETTEETTTTSIEDTTIEDEMVELDTYFEETRFEAKPSLWQRFKNSKFVRTVKYIMQIRVVLDYPALPEGNEDHNY